MRAVHILSAVFALGAVVAGEASMPALAADPSEFVLRGTDTAWTTPDDESFDIVSEFGVRAWYSSGKLRKTLLAGISQSAPPISRLTYDKLDALSGEAYGRIETGPWFLKGYAGLSRLSKGTLQDEDFEPYTNPYSSTDSRQREGRLAYASADFGYDVIDGLDYKLGVFGGIHYLSETVNGYGCAQKATNPVICAPGDVGPSVEAITQDARWTSARLGLSAQVVLFDALRLGADAAWVPRTWFDGLDNHHLRPDIAPTNESGHGKNGVQLEATADYLITPAFSIGGGVRYWRMTADTKATFVDRAGNYLGTQAETYSTERFGVFGHASYKLGM